MNTMPAKSVGDLLRRWRQRRGLSQLNLALDATISSRHLSFVETGRAHPSREMVIHLAQHLEIPLRERNELLIAAGYAPIYPERPFDDTALAAARGAVELVLTGHEPYPALAVDGHWSLVASNRGVAPLLTGVDPALLRPPINVLRLSLHPTGLAPRIINLGEWRSHVLDRLHRQVERTADPVLGELLRELRAYSDRRQRDAGDRLAGERADNRVFVPLQLATVEGPLALLSTTTVFGTPLDVTLAELAIEAFFPADAATADVLRRLQARQMKELATG